MEGIILDEGHSSDVLSASAFNYDVQGTLQKRYSSVPAISMIFLLPTPTCSPTSNQAAFFASQMSSRALIPTSSATLKCRLLAWYLPSWQAASFFLQAVFSSTRTCTPGFRPPPKMPPEGGAAVLFGTSVKMSGNPSML